MGAWNDPGSDSSASSSRDSLCPRKSTFRMGQGSIKMVGYTTLETVSISSHPELSEVWVQNRIAEDPALLGLGELTLRDRERVQPKAGRLDLLLEDPETHRRYEVEVQLGPTDESHIIRTLEYWDIERKRYPHYDHCAVIVAEDITNRFLNVISLFNGGIPIIAIQMKAIAVAENIGLFFTRVLDEVQRGLIDDEVVIAEVTDRAFWENKAAPESVALADRILALVHEVDPNFELKFNKHYIGFARHGQPMNFVSCKPRKTAIILEANIPRSEAVDALIEEADFDVLSYDNQWRQYRVRLKHDELETKREPLSQLINLAYQKRMA